MFCTYAVSLWCMGTRTDPAFSRRDLPVSYLLEVIEHMAVRECSVSTPRGIRVPGWQAVKRGNVAEQDRQHEDEIWWVPEEEQEERVCSGARDFLVALVQAARLGRRAVAEGRFQHELQYNLYHNFVSKNRIGQSETDTVVNLRAEARAQVLTHGVNTWSFKPEHLIRMRHPGELGSAGVDVRGNPDEEQALKQLLDIVGHSKHARGHFYRHNPSGVDRRYAVAPNSECG